MNTDPTIAASGSPHSANAKNASEAGEDRPVVPKIIHQFWDRPDPPSDVAERMQSWRELHPGWAYIQWSDESTESFIGARFGAQAARSFRACVLPTMRADMLRVAAIWVFGGVYADADVLALQPVEPLLDHPATFVTRTLPGKPFVLHLDMMISRPSSALLRAAWKRLLANITKSGGKPLERIRKGELNHPAHLTGPHNFTRAWEALPDADRKHIRLISRDEASRYIEPSRFLSYVKTQGTWKEFKKKHRVVDFDRADRIAAERAGTIDALGE